jgi:hypothetical protein
MYTIYVTQRRQIKFEIPDDELTLDEALKYVNDVYDDEGDDIFLGSEVEVDTTFSDSPYTKRELELMRET